MFLQGTRWNRGAFCRIGVQQGPHWRGGPQPRSSQLKGPPGGRLSELPGIWKPPSPLLLVLMGGRGPGSHPTSGRPAFSSKEGRLHTAVSR